MIRLALRLAPVALALATGACFATRSDVRILQDDITTFRATQQKADSARAAQLAQVVATLGAGQRLAAVDERARGAMAGERPGRLRNIQEQLVQIQELTGASQQRLIELRSQIEERNPAAGAGTVAPIPGDTTRSLRRRRRPPAGPGPATLYKLAFDQMSRGSHSTARSGFQDLLTQYPDVRSRT